MPTSTERRIIEERRAQRSGAILVPILEELLENEVIPEDEWDFKFMEMLVRARAIPRSKGVFSPSMLGSCIRQAYFAKRGEEKHLAHSPQTNGYFLKGNFVHLQWQFALWKAQCRELLKLVNVPAESPELDFYGNGLRPAVEMRVVDGDYGGTVDALVLIDGVCHVVDFKGINVIDYQRTVRKGAKQEYRKQITGYAQLVSSTFAAKYRLHMGDSLLVSESKAGPVSGSGSPIALHETQVPIEEFTGEVNRRMRTLRWFDSRDELPPAECVSTMHRNFQECAFARHCLEEVKERQREREAKARKSLAAKKLKVARPNR